MRLACSVWRKDISLEKYGFLLSVSRTIRQLGSVRELNGSHGVEGIVGLAMGIGWSSEGGGVDMVGEDVVVRLEEAKKLVIAPRFMITRASDWVQMKNR